MRKITKTEKKMMKGKRLLKISLMLVAFFAFSINGKAQTVVTVGGGATVTCPAVPTATWTTPPSGVTFSNWSRGSGVACVSAANALSGSGFNATSAAAGKTANAYYSVTITADASHSFTLNSFVWITVLSGTTNSCNFTVQYSNNGGAVTDFGTAGQTITSSGTQATKTFTGSVSVAPGTSIVIYAIPHNATASGTSVRWINNSTISVTASSLSPCSAPTSAPTALSFSGQTTTAISGSFTAASTAPTGGYLVVQSTSSTLSSNPVDGTTYTAGTALGGGTVCAVNNPTTYTFT